MMNDFDVIWGSVCVWAWVVWNFSLCFFFSGWLILMRTISKPYSISSGRFIFIFHWNHLKCAAFNLFESKIDNFNTMPIAFQFHFISFWQKKKLFEIRSEICIFLQTIILFVVFFTVTNKSVGAKTWHVLLLLHDFHDSWPKMADSCHPMCGASDVFITGHQQSIRFNHPKKKRIIKMPITREPIYTAYSMWVDAI